MRLFTASRIFTGSAAAVGAALLLCACSSGETPNAPRKGPSAAASAARKSSPAASLVPPGMVGAVSSEGSGPATVQVKFELKGRPSVAQPFDIDLAIVPSSGSLDEVSGRVEVGEGLELAAGDQIPPTERPVEGVPIRHSIKLLPKRDGIFTVNAILKLVSAGGSSTRSFSIPVIVGAGLPEPTSKPAATAATKPANTAAAKPATTTR